MNGWIDELMNGWVHEVFMEMTRQALSVLAFSKNELSSVCTALSPCQWQLAGMRMRIPGGIQSLGVRNTSKPVLLQCEEYSIGGMCQMKWDLLSLLREVREHFRKGPLELRGMPGVAQAHEEGVHIPGQGNGLYQDRVWKTWHVWCCSVMLHFIMEP